MNPKNTAQRERAKALSLRLFAPTLTTTTRVSLCNGRKYVTRASREVIPGECVAELAPEEIAFATGQSLTSALLVCGVGLHPHARGQSVCRPHGDWTHTLLFCRDGVGMLELPAGKQTIAAGTFAVLRPDEYHAYAAMSESPWSYYWLHFCGSQAGEYFRLLTDNGRQPCGRVLGNAPMAGFFERILSAYAIDRSYRTLVQASAIMHDLLGELMRQRAEQPAPMLTIDERIHYTVALIERSLHRAVGVDELAAAANMSPSYFAAQFRRRTGENPRIYINKLKVARACEMLANSDEKIESISRQLGYQDPFYFCRVFKRLTGETTSGYRQKCLWRMQSASPDMAEQASPMANAVGR